jgi:hypothetical protein
MLLLTMGQPGAKQSLLHDSRADAYGHLPVYSDTSAIQRDLSALQWMAGLEVPPILHLVTQWYGPLLRPTQESYGHESTLKWSSPATRIYQCSSSALVQYPSPFSCVPNPVDWLINWDRILD